MDVADCVDVGLAVGGIEKLAALTDDVVWLEWGAADSMEKWELNPVCVRWAMLRANSDCLKCRSSMACFKVHALEEDGKIIED